jgi:pentose-5-phosphate-3-epimerase
MREPAIVASVLGADYARLGHTVPFEAHLMVDDPDQWLEPFAAAGCDTVLVHHEACRHLHRTLSRIRELGVRSGVAPNPATPLECVRHVLAHPEDRPAAVAELRRSLQPNVQAPSEERAVR